MRAFGSLPVTRVLDHLAITRGLPRVLQHRQRAGVLWAGAHIEPNWLLIYRTEGDELHLIRTGSHSDLLKE